MSSILETSVCLDGYIKKANISLNKGDIAGAINFMTSALSCAVSLAERTHGLNRNKYVNQANDLIDLIEKLKYKNATSVILPNENNDFNSTMPNEYKNQSIFEIPFGFEDILEPKNHPEIPVEFDDIVKPDNYAEIPIENKELETTIPSEKENDTGKSEKKQDIEVKVDMPSQSNGNESVKANAQQSENDKNDKIEESDNDGGFFTKKVDNLEIKVDKTLFFIDPEVPITIEFWLNQKFENIFLNIAGFQFVCERHINNWICKDINGIGPGKYEVIVRSDRKLISFDVTFASAFVENDLGI